MANKDNRDSIKTEITESSSNYGNYREKKLKPSDDFYKNLVKDNPDAAPGGSNVTLSKKQIERNANVYMDASKGVVANTPKGDMPLEYMPHDKKVSERSGSLKLYASILLTVSIIGLITSLLLLVLINNSQLGGRLKIEYFAVQITALVIYAYPIISSLLLLVGRNVKFVKLLLYINLADCVLVIIQSIVAALFIKVSGSYEYLPNIVIELLFAAWTWSVLAEVKVLMVKA